MGEPCGDAPCSLTERAKLTGPHTPTNSSIPPSLTMPSLLPCQRQLGRSCAILLDELEPEDSASGSSTGNGRRSSYTSSSSASSSSSSSSWFFGGASPAPSASRPRRSPIIVELLTNNALAVLAYSCSSRCVDEERVLGGVNHTGAGAGDAGVQQRPSCACLLLLQQAQEGM